MDTQVAAVPTHVDIRPIEGALDDDSDWQDGAIVYVLSADGRNDKLAEYICTTAARLHQALCDVGTPAKLHIGCGNDEWLRATALGLPERWRGSLRHIELWVHADDSDIGHHDREYVAAMRAAAARACPSCVVVASNGRGEPVDA